MAQYLKPQTYAYFFGIKCVIPIQNKRKQIFKLYAIPLF
jgi:hypothetical protein